MCLPPSVCRVWLDSARQNDASRFPMADRCVGAELALETQPRHLRHATVSFHLTSAGSEMCLLFNSKGKQTFLKIFLKNVFDSWSD